MPPPKLSDLENVEAVRRNKKIFLLIGVSVFIFMALITGLIAAAFYFHVFNLVNVVNGNG
jgi:hypothetical protein